MGNWGYNPYSGVITVLLTGIGAHFVHQCTSHLQPYSDERSNGSFVETKSMMWKSQWCFPIVELRPTCTCSVGRNTNKLYRDKIKMLAKKIKTVNIWWGAFSNKSSFETMNLLFWMFQGVITLPTQNMYYTGNPSTKYTIHLHQVRFPPKIGLI